MSRASAASSRAGRTSVSHCAIALFFAELRMIAAAISAIAATATTMPMISPHGVSLPPPDDLPAIVVVVVDDVVDVLVLVEVLVVVGASVVGGVVVVGAAVVGGVVVAGTVVV